MLLVWFGLLSCTGAFRSSLLFRLVDVVPLLLAGCCASWRHPCFRNFNSAVLIDVIWMKSYVDGFFNPTGIPVRVMVKQECVLLRYHVLKLLSSGCKQAVHVCFFHVLSFFHISLSLFL